MTGRKIQQPGRKTIRLKGYDYSAAGAYFVTICIQNRFCLFGEIDQGRMITNDAGKMIVRWYHELENKFPDIKGDEYIVMPNHFHAVIVNVGADLCVCPESITKVDTGDGEHVGSPLPTIVQWFKTMTTNDYIHGVNECGWSRFPGRLWQRNYHDRIIRNENELNRIRAYIQDNPATWDEDEDNPQNWQ